MHIITAKDQRPMVLRSSDDLIRLLAVAILGYAEDAPVEIAVEYTVHGKLHPLSNRLLVELREHTAGDENFVIVLNNAGIVIRHTPQQ